MPRRGEDAARRMTSTTPGFVGFTPTLASGVWSWFRSASDHFCRTRFRCRSSPVPIWAEVHESGDGRENQPAWFSPPSGVTTAVVVPRVWKAATSGCEHAEVVDDNGQSATVDGHTTGRFASGTGPTGYDVHARSESCRKFATFFGASPASRTRSPDRFEYGANPSPYVEPPPVEEAPPAGTSRRPSAASGRRCSASKREDKEETGQGRAVGARASRCHAPPGRARRSFSDAVIRCGSKPLSACLSKDVIGHRRLIRLLARSVREDLLPPSLIFAGPSGVGKRRTAIATAASTGSRQSSAGPEAPQKSNSSACGKCTGA